MQKAVQLQMDTKEMRYINYCRLCLNVITISDTTETDGIYVWKYITWIKYPLGVNKATSDIINNFQRSVYGMYGGN
jgi:hypothetical protein